MNGQVFRRQAEEFARLADLASDRPGADVARQLAAGAETNRLVALTRTLRGLRIDAGPEPEFRDRLRRRLVAVASVHPPGPASSGAAGTDRVARPPRRRPARTGRAGSPRLAFLAGLAAALVLVTGLTLLASTRALPGDTLYAVKRTSEHIGLAFEHNPEKRGLRQLSLAQTRLAEVDQLLARATGISPGQHGGPATNGAPAVGDLGLLTRTLTDMDTDTREGAALVTGYAVQHHSDEALAALAGWTKAQQGMLAGMLSRLPGAAGERAKTSLALLDQLADRVRLLRRDLRCGCLDGTGRDRLGPLPCLRCQIPRGPASRPGTGTGTGTTRPAPSSSTSGPPPSAAPATSAPTSESTSTAPSATVPTTSAPALPSLLPTITTPNLPVPTSEGEGNTRCDIGGPILC